MIPTHGLNFVLKTNYMNVLVKDILKSGLHKEKICHINQIFDG